MRAGSIVDSPSNPQAKTVAELAAVFAPLSTEQRIDRYWRNWQWKKLNKERLDQYEADGKYLRALYVNADPTGTFYPDGDEALLIVSPCKMERTVLASTALKLWGVKTIRPLLHIGVEALEKAVGAAAAKQAIVETKTGPRELTPILKETPIFESK